MVFGAQGTNPTHWKNLVRKQDQEKLRKDFTKAVLARTGFSEGEWTRYWKHMVDFRNKYLVHRDKFRDKVPHLDKALEVAYAYDRWVRTCFPGDWEEPPFENQKESTRSNMRSYIAHLVRHEKYWV
jgi:ribosomal protein L32E